MKKIAFALLTAALFALVATACDLNQLMSGNTSLARTIRSHERNGFVVANDDRTNYSQYRYIVAPTAPYTDGSGTVTMTRRQGGYSLQVDYAYITFEGYVNTKNQCETRNVAVSYQTIY